MTSSSSSASMVLDINRRSAPFGRARIARRARRTGEQALRGSQGHPGDGRKVPCGKSNTRFRVRAAAGGASTHQRRPRFACQPGRPPSAPQSEARRRSDGRAASAAPVVRTASATIRISASTSVTAAARQLDAHMPVVTQRALHVNTRSPKPLSRRAPAPRAERAGEPGNLGQTSGRAPPGHSVRAPNPDDPRPRWQ